MFQYFSQFRVRGGSAHFGVHLCPGIRAGSCSFLLAPESEISRPFFIEGPAKDFFLYDQQNTVCQIKISSGPQRRLSGDRSDCTFNYLKYSRGLAIQGFLNYNTPISTTRLSYVSVPAHSVEVAVRYGCKCGDAMDDRS